MAIRKRGDHWHYDFTIRGVRYRAAIPEARTRNQAIRAETQAREDVYNGKFRQPDHSPTLTGFIDETYLAWSKKNKRSWYDDELIIKHVLKPAFGSKRLAEITPKMVRRFQQDRLDTPVKKGKTATAARQPATVNRELSVLSRVFTLAVEEELIRENPCRKVKQLEFDNEVVSYLTQEEEGRLLKHCVSDREHLRAVVLIAVNTGMRSNELFNLRKYQLDFNLNRIVIGRKVRSRETTKTKTGRGRIIPMNSIVRGELLKLAAGKGDLEYLFTYPATGKPIKSVKRSFAKACERAKLEGFRFYDLRHTFGTRLAEAGESLHRIAELMGHSNIQMTMRYVHAAAAGKHAAVERLVKYGEDPGHKSVTKAKEQAS